MDGEYEILSVFFLIFKSMFSFLNSLYMIATSKIESGGSRFLVQNIKSVAGINYHIYMFKKVDKLQPFFSRLLHL